MVSCGAGFSVSSLGGVGTCSGCKGMPCVPFRCSNTRGCTFLNLLSLKVSIALLGCVPAGVTVQLASIAEQAGLL